MHPQGANGLIRVEVLGPVRAWNGEVELDLGAPRQRAVLAVLASRVGRPVARGELIDGLWGEQAPVSAEGSVHTYVAGLRRALEPDRTHRAPAKVLANAGSGYVLRLADGQLDLVAFEQHLRRTRLAATSDDVDTALRNVEAAVNLWRGTPLSGIPGPFSEFERTRLTEMYLTALEQRAELMLRTGRDAEVVAELSRIVHEHPLREQLRGLLMTALYRSGRQAEALEVYGETRRHLAEELGVEPGPELRGLHERILTNEAALSGTSTPRPTERVTTRRVVPAQLPHDMGGFTGREAELVQLEQFLAGDDNVVRIAAIDGSGGIGKTALAVHFAHRIAERFPDGQLYVNLRGFDPQQPPLVPGDALGQLLRGLGVDAQQVSTDPDEQAGMFRSMVAGKKMLVLLDNAASTDQVRSLLPGSASCVVLVTSRNRLGGLVARDGAHRITLGVLSEAESVSLLEHSIGAQRVAAEPAAVSALVARCGHLPLALRIVASNLADRRHLTVDDLVESLSIEQDRLDVLSAPDDESTAVRGVFSWSYHACKPEATRTFRLLGLHPGPDISTAAAAALTGRPVPVIRRVLDGLAGGHLIEEVGRDRYRLHDLVRVYAAERAEDEETEAERRAAVHRLVQWYLHTAHLADRLLMPQRRPVPLEQPVQHCLPQRLENYEQALAWLVAERMNLVAICLHAHESGDHDTAWRLASVLHGFFQLRSHWEDWAVTHRAGLASARAVNKPGAVTVLLTSLGGAYWHHCQYDEALRCYEEALRLSREIGDRQCTATALNDLGAAYADTDRAEEALEHFRQSLEIFAELGDRGCEGMAMYNMAKTHQGLGQFDTALGHLCESLDLVRQTGDRRCEAAGLTEFAAIHHVIGRLDEARAQAVHALEIFNELGDRHGAARVLRTLGAVQRDSGEPEAARQSWTRALEVFDELGAPQAEEISALLAELG
ncbi:BTAD domain-containing putative transcriptional regulator [Kutzneria viridogrisea]|uniref:DNA-binding SARP family transcriptional activator/tetratricopeptide (TPR) repeat protein n=1 Tax=Kutzneria viridogrisea TaxID=47990 RepID=A0ABR6BXL9_9PSEU|nr:DNA-binding SARP family transcriptional activator/tetratricopeptide (TPR) repeat protein [Kutzneria viridogrisea]